MGILMDRVLDEIGAILQDSLDAEGAMRILKVLDGPSYSREFFDELVLYSDLLPLGREHPYAPEQRYLHFLWDAFDKLPLCLNAQIGILYRRMLAERLFARCGGGFIAEENVRFNFGQNLTVGEFVFMNRGVFIDSKGGVTLGDHVALTEDVRIFSHSHSEASHLVREYHPVVIEDYAKIYTGAVIMPGVTVGRQAIVAAHAVVTKDVPANAVAAGMPAQVIRERKTDGHSGEGLDHIWLF